jgi:type II secretory pathway component PulF
MAIDLTAVAAGSEDREAARTGGLTLPRRRQRVSRRDRKFFTEQLGLLLETGTPLVSALDLIARQAVNPALGDVVGRIANAVREGSTFTAALRAHPAAFPGTYATLIEASERGGYIDRVLRHLLTMEENREELESSVISAFTYPAFLTVFSGAVVIFILGFVFPKFAELFASIADQLPVTTKVLMAASTLVSEHGAWLALGVVAAAAGLAWFVSRPGAAEALHGAAERVPGLRELMLQFYFIQSMRVVSLSLANGVTLVDAIQACEGAVGSPRFNAFLKRLRAHVNEGKGFAGGFDEAEFVPPLARQMVVTGEEAGKLELVTRRIADHYQLLLERRLETVSKIAEPVMLLVMGVVVGLIVSSLILPIFKLSRAVH